MSESGAEQRYPGSCLQRSAGIFLARSGLALPGVVSVADVLRTPRGLAESGVRGGQVNSGGGAWVATWIQAQKSFDGSPENWTEGLVQPTFADWENKQSSSLCLVEDFLLHSGISLSGLLISHFRIRLRSFNLKKPQLKKHQYVLKEINQLAHVSVSG